MTGTPLDLTPFGPLVKGLGLLYWVVALLLIGVALWLFKRWWLRLSVSAAILAAFVVPAVQRAAQQQEQYDAAKVHLDAAKAHFEMRCNSASEVIHRVVSNVDGIVLLKIPGKHDYSRVADPTYPEAARFGEPTDDGYIRSWLRWPRRPRASSAQDNTTYPVGYEFVDVIDAGSATRYRYRIVLRKLWPDRPDTTLDLAREIATSPRPRYGVTYEDVIDTVDREHWIASDVLRIIDLETNETVGERKRYLWDTGLGSTVGFRQPWTWAGTYGKRCPEQRGKLDTKTPQFIHKVLIPAREE
jgi:hypothetical protein